MAGRGQPKTDDLNDAAQALQGLKILTAPAPRPTGRRPYEPKPPPIDGLTEAVWDSYQRPDDDPEKYKIIPVPPEYVEALRKFLLQAKNYLDWKHGLKEANQSIHGLDKKDVEILDREIVTDLEVLKLIPKGMAAVRFAARKPKNKGMRARQAKLADRGKQRSDEISSTARRRPRAT